MIKIIEIVTNFRKSKTCDFLVPQKLQFDQVQLNEEKLLETEPELCFLEHVGI